MGEVQSISVPEKLHLGGKFLIRLPEAQLHGEKVEDGDAEAQVPPAPRRAPQGAAGPCQGLRFSGKPGGVP